MTKNRSTKRALLMSALSLLLCVSMLVGTTYAWFTDSVASGMNTIMAGNLDVALLADGKEVGAETKLFDDVTLWEPGAVVYENLQVVNKGSLALQYQMALNFEDENELEGHKLSQVLKVAIIDQIETKDRATVLAAAKAAKAISLYDFFVAGSLEANAEAEEQGVVIFWEPGENDNLYNANNGKTTSNGKPLGITFGIKLVATQVVSEKDSFGNEYDENAGAEFFDGFQGGTVGVAVKTDDQGLTTAEVAQAGGDVAVRIPAGVKVKDGVSTLKLSVTSKDHADANVQLNENEEMRPLDVHIEGVAEGNTVPMLITLKHYLSTGINTGALRLYHVENGTPVAMTQVATPTAHNEFSYDPATGDLVLAMASFSEVAVAVDSTNPWDGKTLNYLWYDKDAKELTIYNADQLAGFAAIVDGKAEGIAQDSFESKTVKLANNIYLSGKNFDPIGWGYVNKGWNRDGADGKVFQGTFDGGQYDGKNLVGRYTIFDLKQNGWELEEANGTDYTYTNCGFGLFAAASDATFKNLTISGANIATECVEMGVLVGMSQNNCTYDNIKILNSKIANYQRPAGGLIGEVSGEGTTTITNVTIGDDVVVGSLWGDFDAPCGGVIGARWDDAGKNPQIKMTNVEVGARMDVYNDITSAYQWHAYRRAGMLIGNTELTEENDPHKAAALFLTCENVNIYYGDWVNYTYCDFSNHNARYPWVRTQAGENCTAFSNPRWGVPNDLNGNRVVDMNHVHAEGNECNVPRQFSQLYGGGQGVYGQDKHPGVTVQNSHYSITYVNDNHVLDIIYVTNNSNAVKVANDQAQKLVEEWAGENIDGTWKFGGWMNAASKTLTEIPANNEKDIVLYPYFNNPYTARFVDQQGNVITWCLFHSNDVSELADAFAAAKKVLPMEPDTDVKLTHFEVRGENMSNQTLALDNSNWDSFKNYKDVTIYPVYQYTGNLKLTPVFDELTGEIVYYKVEAVKGLTGTVTIPGNVNGVPVAIVEDLCYGSSVTNLNTGLTKVIINEGVERIESNALAYTTKLNAVELPSTLEYIGKGAFSSDWGTVGSWIGQKQKITIDYNGTCADWEKLEKNSDANWDSNLIAGSLIKCNDGYYVLDRGWTGLGSNNWEKHFHVYGTACLSNCPK